MVFIIILILIFINGFFSLSEIAVISSKESRLEQMGQNGSKGASVAIKLRKDSDNFLSSVQVGITMVGLITGAYGGIALSAYLTPVLLKVDFLAPYANTISVTIIMILTTYVTIVLGELVPKTIALSNPEKVATLVAPIINVFSKIFYPFVWLLAASTSFIASLLGIQKQSDQMTETELRQMIKAASQEGVIEEEQNEIHNMVFNFSDKRAKHLMTHRIEVEWLDLTEKEDEIRKAIDLCKHSKMVCCKGSLDNFAGVLLIKNYYKAVLSGEEFKVEDLVTDAVVIHEKTPAPLVLEHLKQSRSHFCVVVDEYGDFEGIVTIHDILENFVGLIPDEGDEDEPSYFVRSDNSILINGDSPVEVLSEIIDEYDIDFERIDYSTVAGFIIDQVNEIPKEGDKIQYLDYTFEIMDMDGNRIDKVLLIKPENKQKDTLKEES